LKGDVHARFTHRHAESAGGSREVLVALIDVTNDIIGGITLPALPIIVMTPGLIARLRATMRHRGRARLLIRAAATSRRVLLRPSRR
jgi:hypothetical protein